MGPSVRCDCTRTEVGFTVGMAILRDLLVGEAILPSASPLKEKHVEISAWNRQSISRREHCSNAADPNGSVVGVDARSLVCHRKVLRMKPGDGGSR